MIVTPELVRKKVKNIRGMESKTSRDYATINLYISLIESISEGRCQSPSNCCSIAIELSHIPENNLKKPIDSEKRT